MRILVVEDEKRLAGTLADLLHRQGYTVDVSNDGVSGLDNALSGIYDLVVLDVMLPGMDGFELLRRLRGEGKTTPVLMLTARSGVADRVQGLDCCAARAAKCAWTTRCASRISRSSRGHSSSRVASAPSA